MAVSPTAQQGRSKGGGLSARVLGSGDAFGSGGRFQSGYLIGAAGTRILMEAGPAILPAMKRAAISPDDIDLVLISHLHGDHFSGLPFLILEYLHETPRRRPLTIAGPRLLEQRTWKLYFTMFPRSDVRAVASKLKFVVLQPNREVTIGSARVATIRTPHTKPDISLGLRVTAGGGSIAFSGDTGWTDDLLKLSDGADVFLCECTYFENIAMPTHLNYPLLAEQRHRFNVGRMVLTHLGSEVLRRASEVTMETAFDGMTIEL